MTFWSGGCATNAAAATNGFFTYCLNAETANFAGGNLSVAANGIVTFNTGGLYRVRFANLARGCPTVYVRFYVNEVIEAATVTAVPNTAYQIPLRLEHIAVFSPGDTLRTELFCFGAADTSGFVYHGLPAKWGGLTIYSLGVVQP